jgi:hypothetical protein
MALTVGECYSSYFEQPNKAVFSDFFFFAFESVLTMNSSCINFDLEVSQKKNFDLE